MSDYECDYSDDEWSDSEWLPPPPKAPKARKTKPLWLPPRSAENPCVLWLQFDPKYKKYYAADPATGKFYTDAETLALIDQIRTQDEAREIAQKLKQFQDCLQIAKASLATIKANTVVIAVPEVPRVEFEHVVVIQTIIVPLSIAITEPVVPVTETHALEIITVPPVADKPEPKPAKAQYTAKTKVKSKKTKLQKTEQRAKAVSYYGCYSYSASMRQCMEQQLWVEVDPYFDEEQAIFQLWTDMTRPPEDYGARQ